MRAFLARLSDRRVRMRSMKSLVGVLAATGLLAGSIGAQTCLGRPYFSTGPLQADAGVGLGKNMRTFGGSLNVGVDRAFFGGIGLAHVDDGSGDGVNSPSGSALDGRIGYQANLRTRSTVQVCPIASFERQHLDYNSLNDNADLRTTVATAGASLGFVVPVNHTVHFVPFAGLALAKRTGSFDVAGVHTRVPAETYTPGTFGLGVHFGRNWMLTGDVMVPFGLESDDPVFGLTAVLPFGRSR